ncbi:MAG: sulfatase-like hydrolase/transferase, partial [Clostridia bacterium]|nr:sulfatase-like hydrolase/transferase [Clostridia bacterium]
NNNGTFYDRHKVYPNLGFDHFVSIEYMDNIRENDLSWAKDGLLTQQILKCLDDAEQSGFVYTVAVQPHGRYPSEPTGESYPITASGLPSAEEKNQWEYYVGQMYETDSFIRDLTHALDDRGEPYICIFYGDHLPSLDILDDELASGNIYQTEYFIRSNMELPADDRDLSAYQLSARVLEMAGLEGNVLFSLHQTESEEPDYQKNLELLEYDILYGEQEALDGKLPEPTDLQMGVDPITITKAYIKEDGLWVEGKNLTWESYIFVNGKPYGETERRGSNLLFAAGDDIEPGDVVSVVQMGNDGEPLSYTNEILIN